MSIRLSWWWIRWIVLNYCLTNRPPDELDDGVAICSVSWIRPLSPLSMPMAITYARFSMLSLVVLWRVVNISSDSRIMPINIRNFFIWVCPFFSINFREIADVN